MAIAARCCLIGVLFAALLGSIGIVNAYIPATPTNDTSPDTQRGPDANGSSRLHLQWYQNGSDWEYVSYQLVGNNSNGVSQGVLVHFSEDYAFNSTTITPWIALIACDANATNASMEDDIFTLARDRGAVSALLYSNFSEQCIINSEYADPENFDQVFDIFATQSEKVSHFIEYEFGEFGPGNESYYGYFNATRLNQSFADVNQSLNNGSPEKPGWLYGSLIAYNATGSTAGGSNNGSGTVSSGNSGSHKSTGLAMIILYAITGLVSALFCIVIISGAIRAVRHPERYGSMTAHHGGVIVGQSRAQGLGRAILDTFPIVKFGHPPNDHSATIPKDIETTHNAPEPGDRMEMLAIPSSEVPPPVGRHRPFGAGGSTASGETQELGYPQPRPSASTGLDRSQSDVMPDQIGRETCPICIVDFEAGDDLRVLPCEGKHRFHQTCVDPWLLELSGSCPICRHDFHALEAMLSESGFEQDDPAVQRRSRTMSQGNRFSRYLRFARRRHQRNQRSLDTPGEGADNPPLEPVEESGSRRQGQ
ncbi:hypothetical protein CONPUDRAFT_81157 [Coniophora puteana RWD-64-598 SS2]|uniref:RING-type domain-containing protein n=1 Tax=Coniophora puteana (strain RWD-64-598) TaxID=741705 RepID=A0A5M3MVC7_CONPW|nr:uncharacterized protein CONPUDRAFT_81157 [Coniophora puteana RWD-64-598 SS2]EIW83076.1 hypothetical protein CONPUDRAFT_81157 [Coniophora puteana RWD-64-598 SS2]